jgi:dethiobiotin synthase
MLLFITGTDTGVGKTYFTAALTRALKELGREVVAFKPVESGCGDSCSDAEELSRASGVRLSPVYSFKAPLAPAVAAELEKRPIDVEKIIKAIGELSSRYEITLVEGAGGIMVPITWSFSFLELSKSIGAEVLIVALNKLGVINHTLLTVKVCQSEGIGVRGVILNSPEAKDESFYSNYESLKRLLSVPLFEFSSYQDARSIALKLVE